MAAMRRCTSCWAPAPKPATAAAPDVWREQTPKGGGTDALLAALAARYEGRVSTVDGVKVDLDEGWAHVRKSNTEPVLVMRMEATSDEQLASMKALADERVSGIINIEKLLNA